MQRVKKYKTIDVKNADVVKIIASSGMFPAVNRKSMEADSRRYDVDLFIVTPFLFLPVVGKHYK